MTHRFAYILQTDVDPVLATGRWTATRKSWLLFCIKAGAISADQACERYGLSMAEIEAWTAAQGRDGLHGLRAQVVAPVGERQP